MAERSSFFNSVDGDRKYQASDYAEYFNSLITNGVFPNPSTNLQVLSNNDMTVTLSAGRAWINGYIYINDSDLIAPVEVADGVLKRIDRVVIRFDTIGRAIYADIKKGVFASNPVAPTLQRDADLWELGIADISIVNGATSITQANITDLRLNTDLCGYVNSLIQADTTAIFNQYEAWYTSKQNAYDGDFTSWTNEKQSAYDLWYSTTTTTEQGQIDDMQTQFQTDFDTWFNAMKGQLTTDAAGNLQTQIDTLEGTGWTTETVKGNADAIVTTNTNVTNLSDSVDASLAETVQQTKADITYYVATTGSDTNDGLTVETAFKTIQYAIDKLPQIINNTVIINVSAGTYAESLLITGFVGKGKIVINGATSTTTTHNILYMSIENCGIAISARGFNMTTTSMASLTIANCINVYVYYINSISSASFKGVSITNSLCYITLSTISNKTSAINASRMSTVVVKTINGVGNTWGLYASESSIIGKSGTQPAGTTAETVTSGGVIR